MKVFISWSGDRSQQMAKALREWFPLVLHYIQPWLSQDDIRAGDRWGVEVARELNESNFGVICITRENINSPWLLFEAGALAKSMEDGRVVPLLLDLDFQEISGPLAQFQAKKLDSVGLRELVLSINAQASGPLPEARIEALFEPLWPKIDGMVSAIPTHVAEKNPKRSQDEILEELVTSVRSMELQYRNTFDREFPGRRRKSSKIHPELMQMIVSRVGLGPGDPMNALIICSYLRDDFPWLYELAHEVYRQAMAKDSAAHRSALLRFQEAVDLIIRTPLAEEMGIDILGLRMLRSLTSEFFGDFDSDVGAAQRVARRARNNLVD